MATSSLREDTVNVLRSARELYAASPSHAPFGQDVEPGCHCIITALTAASGICNSNFIAASTALTDATGAASLIDFNAVSTTEQVIAAFDAVIEGKAHV